MKLSICHYSYHRTWVEENWDCKRLCQAVKDVGADAVDFHVKFLGDPATASARVNEAIKSSGVQLSGLSMSNNFNQDDPAELEEQISAVKTWLKVAAEVNAPVSRIFGGHIPDRSDKEALKAGLSRIVGAVGEVTVEAEKLGVVLALENHGGLPCTGEEQVDVIKAVNSPNLRATIDVGNYMQGGQEGHIGTEIAADLASYVHFKDFKKKNQEVPWQLEACVVGDGDVDHLKCLQALVNAGYEGYIALEYEGGEDERTGVPKSLEFTKKVLREVG